MKEVNNFKNAKVGDKVWCLLNGEGEIKEIDRRTKTLSVKFVDGAIDNYLEDGRDSLYNRNPSLFRTPPTVTAPEPKRRLRKKIFILWFKSLHTDEIYHETFMSESQLEREISEMERGRYGAYLKTETIEREFEV